MAGFRILVLTMSVATLVWFSFFNSAPAHVLGQRFTDQFDQRPARRMLFVGNSRMFFNDMPGMVRQIADSADAPEKYQITMWATPGETVQGHWEKGTVARLLGKESWDEFVLQAESGAHHDPNRQSFAEHGAKLVGEAKRRGVPAALIVGWPYGIEHFDGDAESQAHHHSRIQSDHRKLAGATGAKLINAGSTWTQLERSRPPFKLTSDANHPTVQGTYLVALMTYAHLSGGDISKVTFVPDGMNDEQAALIREVAASSLRSGLG